LKPLSKKLTLLVHQSIERVAPICAIGPNAVKAITNSSANGTGGIVYKLASIRLTSAVSANTLTLTWPVAGGRLQAQTNGLGTNWVSVAGSTTTNRVDVPINPANTSVFYRLAVP